MLSSVNYQKMKKAEVIDRCKKLEELLCVKNMNIAMELSSNDSKKKLEKKLDGKLIKSKYGIDYYFNTERDEDEVCINVDFKNNT